MSDSSAKSPAGQVKELKVSGHIMVMQPGLYCVFNAPGTAPLPDGSGLPGVRITVAPGAAVGQVDVATFRDDGWIGSDAAAIVRVTAHPAELLVTVYQAAASTGDGPQLQVVRLSEDAAAAPAPTLATAAAVAGRPAPDDVEVVAHIYARGDVPGRLGNWMGEPGSNRWIEGFGLAPSNGIPLADVEYQAVLGRGWLSPWSEGGQFCGSRGMSLPILGLRVRLRGDSARTHRVKLNASFVDGTRIGPVGDGDACEAPSLAALEAFQVSIEPIGKAVAKEAKIPAAKTKPAIAKPAIAKPTIAKPGASKPEKTKAAPAKPAAGKRSPPTTRRR